MHKLALLMKDIARASVSAVVGLFMLGVAIVIEIIVLVTIIQCVVKPLALAMGI